MNIRNYVGPALAMLCTGAPVASAQEQYAYETLDFGTSGTFLTGIRGNNIVGNYTIPGGNTAGLLYDIETGIFTQFPVDDGGSNFPGALASSPYGPSVGNPDGILRVVGSYKTTASSPYDLGYFYDGAAAPGSQLTTLIFPSDQNSSDEATLFTIAHSNFGDQVVGNYDTVLITGNAFLYSFSTDTYTNINKPGAVSTTAYGVWGDKIAGGFVAAGVGVPQQGFIYDQTTDTWTDYNHPGAISTHFEGITGGGSANTYILVANWFDVSGGEHASVLHISAAGFETWYDIDIADAETTSANSIYGDQAIGIYVDADGIHGYVTTIPGIYTPLTNSAAHDVDTPGVAALSGVQGEDIVNSGAITTNGANNNAIQGDTYGVIANNGSLTVHGAGSAGVVLDGSYGTLLNNGTITAAAGTDAVRNGAGAVGSAIVNSGTIDGLVNLTAGSGVRFENSGWMGISAAGAGATHGIDGVFAQTSDGTLSLRFSETGSDALAVAGPARLAGTLQANFASGITPLNSYTVLTTTDGVTGTFATVESNLANYAVSTSYSTNDVMLDLTPSLGRASSLSGNDRNVAGTISNVFDANGTLPANFLALFDLSGAELSTALSQISGEAAADGQQGGFQLMSGFLGYMLDASAGAGAGAPGDGPAAFAAEWQPSSPFHGTLSFTPVRGAPKQSSDQRWSVWTASYGGSARNGGNAAAGTNTVTTVSYGLASGLDYRLTPDTTVGFAMAGGGTDWDLAQSLGSGSSEAVQAGVYGRTQAGPAYLAAGLAVAHHWMTTDRTASGGNQLSANFNAQSYAGRLETGYRLAPAPSFGFTPYTALVVQRFRTPGYSEADLTGGGFGLSYDDSTATNTRSELGARFDGATELNDKLLNLFSRVAWAHQLESDTSVTAAFQTLPGSGFTVNGAAAPRNAVLVSAGAELNLSVNWSLGARLDGDFASDSQSYAGTGILRYTWN